MHLTTKIAVHFDEHITTEEAEKIMLNFQLDLVNTGAVKSIENVDNIFDHIREWARQKGILEHGDPKTQTVKLFEEAGEIAAAVLRNNKANTMDGIGDCVVVLTSLAHLAGTSIEECIGVAYNEISGRKGKIVNGDFQKDGTTV